jgi:ribosomal protein S18 acetylase RimI-like enzyme
MVTLADIRETQVAAQIHALQRAAYSVEAQRIGCSDFPPLRETLDALQRSTDCFLVFAENGSIIGCLSYEWARACATITRLVVSPRHFRRGVASTLLRTLESRLPVGSVVCAVTAELNEAAIRAYERQGYTTASREISSEGIALRQLYKQLGAARG